ncbi:PREDICTED: transforming growth factor beta regulator 1 [Haliaeetus leucocephalus]|uniref:transforming growth factor beta regulator 1 n=1 Tax=Haliaeetus leucocephalus TaxID=52644 RepID=UPI00053CED12|nr:PREDICTED: transforming growth factor beta regulator 1 [Haliaeetus leucocephalus]
MPKGPRQRPAERYRLKYSRLRRAARALVFENGALCDEVARLEAKCLRARDERRFLLTRLLQLRAMAGPEEITGEVTGRRPRRGGSRADGSRDGGKDGARSTGGREGSRPTGSRDGARDGARSTGSRDGPRDEPRPTGPRDGPRDESRPSASRPVGSRDESRPTGSRDGPGDASRSNGARDGPRDGSRTAGLRDGPRDDSRDGLRPAGPRDGPRDDLRPNGPRGGPKLDVPPAAILRPPEDTSSPAGPPAAILRPPPRRRGGTLTLPLALGPLTVHSLGVGGLGPGAILPLGFHSTRLFTSTRRPARRCLYTCRIVAGPRCEIVSEDEPGRVLAGPTPDVCHGRLLQALGEAGGRARAMPPAPGAGADFFGLTHPTVRRLLQGEAGAFLHPEDEEEEEEEEEEEDDDDEDDEEEEEEEGAAPAFAYADIFLGSPTGSDE